MGDPIQFKDEGNKHFQTGDIDKAIECYSNAIEVCKDKKVLAVIHRNRSACYLKKVSNLLNHHKRQSKISAITNPEFNLQFSVFLTGELC